VGIVFTTPRVGVVDRGLAVSMLAARVRGDMFLLDIVPRGTSLVGEPVLGDAAFNGRTGELRAAVMGPADELEGDMWTRLRTPSVAGEGDSGRELRGEFWVELEVVNFMDETWEE
jgi:hypothetical protein